jgi:hypothetical protein
MSFQQEYDVFADLHKKLRHERIVYKGEAVVWFVRQKKQVGKQNVVGNGAKRQRKVLRDVVRKEKHPNLELAWRLVPFHALGEGQIDEFRSEE